MRPLLCAASLLTLTTINVMPVQAESTALTPSDHFDGSKFFNPNQNNPRGLMEVAKWLITRERADWPTWVPINHYPLPKAPTRNDLGQATFINHATFLIQFANFNVLTDPIFSERASPVSWAGPKRVHEPGIPLHQLPPIDLVLISHNHYDHLDIPTLQYLAKNHNPLFITGLRVGELLKESGIERVIELDWWEKYSATDDISIIYTPAQHFSARGLFDRNNTLWGGFFINFHKLKVFFAGDTGYSPHFQEIGIKLGHPDLALLPIGAYLPDWFMRPMHNNPADSVQAHQDLQARQSIGMHFGTFQMTDEPRDQPVTDLHKALEDAKINKEVFVAPLPGQSFEFTAQP